MITMKACLLLAALLPLSQPLDDDSVLLLGTLEWVRSHGGYFYSKLEFGRKDGIMGILAAEPIGKGETLIATPWELIIQPDMHGSQDDDPCYSPLAVELRKGEDSFFAPYIRRYLSQYSMTLLPATWSDEGKDLLGLIFGYGNLPPYNAFTELFWRWRNCEKRDDIQMLAISMHETHCEEDPSSGACELFVPLEDIITNHCSGDDLPCLDLRYGENKTFIVESTRDVEKGEMFCHNYYGEDTGYGTPELLRDYGFVESLPQRWIFDKYEIGFDLVENDGEVRVVWFDKVTPKVIRFFHNELRRLQNDVRLKLEAATAVPPNEMETVWLYYEALAFALEKATAASESGEAMDEPEL